MSQQGEELQNKNEEVINKNKRHRKDKPWDDPSIDHWKVEEIKPGEMPPLLEESSFSVLFPQYREKYVQECQGIVRKKLMDGGIKLEVNLLEGSMTVRTTKKTWDPYYILKARDVIRLISRSVPYQQALRVLNDYTTSEVIKIRSYVRNRERFIKRRQRLIGPNGDTLKALELLTQSYILVQGSTVCIIGGFKNVKILRRIIIDTMLNVHPIYHIKEMMVKRELMKDENMKGQNWDKFLPHFTKVRSAKKKNKRIHKSKNYTPFPPEQTPRKEDVLMETGEYFLSEKEKKERVDEYRRKKQEKAKRAKEIEKEEMTNEREEIAEEKRREEKRRNKNNAQETSLEELKEKFLTKPLKKVTFQ